MSKGEYELGITNIPSNPSAITFSILMIKSSLHVNPKTLKCMFITKKDRNAA